MPQHASPRPLGSSWRDPLEDCRLCPHRCGVNRHLGQTGRCGGGAELTIYRFGPHLGEEPPISGFRGSGTIFFSGCPLRCIYCQNHRWSQARPLVGRRYELEDFIDLCLGLQRAGCHNVNLVTPEPWIPHVVEGIRRARGRGLRVPVVYNTSGFIAEASLAMLEGTVDVYLTDVRYASPQQAQEFSGAASYFEECRRAAVTMWRQVGPLVCDSRGIARTGLIVRHLVLPGLPEATATGQRLPPTPSCS